MIRRLVLATALLPALAFAGAPERPRQDGGGQEAAPQRAEPSDEDREVIENLDLLQSMDSARDLELLLELNQAKDDE